MGKVKSAMYHAMTPSEKARYNANHSRGSDALLVYRDLPEFRGPEFIRRMPAIPIKWVGYAAAAVFIVGAGICVLFAIACFAPGYSAYCDINAKSVGRHEVSLSFFGILSIAIAILVPAVIFIVRKLGILKDPDIPFGATRYHQPGDYDSLVTWLKRKYGDRFRPGMSQLETQETLLAILRSLDERGSFKAKKAMHARNKFNGFRKYIMRGEYGDLLKVKK